MAQIKSQIKRIRTNEKAHQQNLKVKKIIKNINKKIKLAIKNKDNASINLHFKKIISLIDKAANNKIIHINKASRQKSKITKLINKINEVKTSTATL